jgi:hypothetical protein
VPHRVGVRVLARVRQVHGYPITALPRSWLMCDDHVAALHPDRHEDVGRRIRNLIGP